VVESASARKEIRKCPQPIQRKYEEWKAQVVAAGPAALRAPGWHDEPLKGRLAGLRSSRLSLHYRLIYRIAEAQISVAVIAVTPHDYRKIRA
jgi:proteic killer suppression protein